MMVASASQTTQQSVRSAVWPSEEKIGPSRVPMQGATEEPRSIPSSKHANSTTSILRLGSPTCWHASQTIQQIRSPISCHGIGKPRVSPSPPDRSRAQDPGSPAVLVGWIHMFRSFAGAGQLLSAWPVLRSAVAGLPCVRIECGSVASPAGARSSFACSRRLGHPQPSAER
jgi:hypothetical protein